MEQLRKLIGSVALALGLVAMASSGAQAQQIDASELIGQIKQGTDQFVELRPYLTAEDLNTRLSAFSALVNHGDKTLFELAISTAMADTSEVMRARALWEVMARRANIAITFDTQKISENTELKKYFKESESPYHLVFPIYQIFAEKQCLNLYSNNSECRDIYHIDVSGLAVTLKYSNQSGQFILDDDGVLRGDYSFGGHTYPASIAVR